MTKITIREKGKFTQIRVRVVLKISELKDFYRKGTLERSAGGMTDPLARTRHRKGLQS